MTIKKNRNRKLDGKIVKVIDGVKNASTGQSVIINLGKKDGLNVGNLLSVVEKKQLKGQYNYMRMILLINLIVIMKNKFYYQMKRLLKY